jgi:hypothetical protein
MTTAWVVQMDQKRDYSAAEEFGTVKEVFSGVHRDFLPEAAVFHARKLLGRAHHDDWLVMAGDPTLCGVCIQVFAAKHGVVKVLRWNKRSLNYEPMIINFEGEIL